MTIRCLHRHDKFDVADAAATCEGGHGDSEAEPGLRLCGGCISDTQRRLASLPWLYMQCVSMPQWEYEPAGRSHRGDRRVLPLSTAALDLRVRTSSILKSWVDLVISDDANALLPATRDVAATASFLNEWIRWLAAHPSAADFVIEIADLHRDALRFLYGPRENRTNLGNCPEPACGGTLSLQVPNIGENALVKCSEGHARPLDEWLRVQRILVAGQELPQQRQHTLPTNAAAKIFGIKAATIRQWARRGRLTRYGEAGRAEYDIYEIAEILQE